MTAPGAAVRVWDLPTRIFHWGLAALVVFSFTTGQLGGEWMAWHLRSGYAVLALVLFRLAWGFAGPGTSRFARFVRGPRAALAYGRQLLARRHAPVAGHNPLGGWMVLVLLGLVLAQALTGLFADDEIATQGPLAVKVSNAMVARMSAWHSTIEWALVAAVALHVAAIAAYRWVLGVRLVGPMLHGRQVLPPGLRPPPPASRPLALAAALLAAAAALVYFLVVAYPAS